MQIPALEPGGEIQRQSPCPGPSPNPPNGVQVGCSLGTRMLKALHVSIPTGGQAGEVPEWTFYDSLFIKGFQLHLAHGLASEGNNTGSKGLERWPLRKLGLLSGLVEERRQRKPCSPPRAGGMANTLTPSPAISFVFKPGCPDGSLPV